MSDSTVNIRIDANLKAAASEIFAKLGLTMTSGISIYLTQVVNLQGIPFPLTVERKLQLSERAFEMEKGAQSAVNKAVNEAKLCGLPVARYDTDSKRPYMEYPDGRREYDLSRIKEDLQM